MHGAVDHLNQPTVSRIIREVSIAIAKHRGEFIRFPKSRDQVQRTQEEFFGYCNFPGVVGAIDCTHIGIRCPGGDNSLAFMNRKNRYSVNTQVVCDNNGIITNIVARWPGSAHDSRIFNESTLKEHLERTDDQWLLGDSGYACSRYLMTPLLHPQTPEQRRYNMAQRRGRCIIERCFGMIKKRFPCLNQFNIKLATVLPAIIAVFVLWNISRSREEPEVQGEEPEEIPGDEEPPQGQPLSGAERRRRIIEEHFTH